MNTLQAQTAYIGSTEIKQVRLGNELVLAPNGDELWYKANELPSLDLRFANDKSLVDATTGANLVDFTRASSGTYVDSEGVIRTATTNLLTYSEEFNDASWVKSGSTLATVTVNDIASPVGTITGDRINATVVNAGVYKTVAVVANVPLTLSGYIKAGSNINQVLFRDDNDAGRHIAVRLSDGAIVGTAGVVTSSSSVAVGNGWYRIAMTYTPTSAQARWWFRNDTSNSGDFYLWGAQLEQSTTVGEYIPTTSTINSAPRFDHDPTTGESLGLLVEEQRTNLLLQSQDFTTTWLKSNALMSVTADAAVAPDGNTTADTLTKDASGFRFFYQGVTATAGATYSASVFLKAGTLDKASILVSGDGGTTPDGRVVFDFAVKTATNFSSTGLVSASITEFPNGWFRCVVVATISSNTNPRVLIYLDTYNAAVAGSIYAWGAQLEAGSFPTSYIPTTDATATRAADVASISGSNFSSWYRQDEGTVFARASSPVASSIFAVDDGSAGNRIIPSFLNTTTSPSFRVVTGGSDQANFSPGSITAGAVFSQASAYKANDFATALDGGTAAVDTSGIVSTGMTSARIGANVAGVTIINGHHPPPHLLARKIAQLNSPNHNPVDLLTTMPDTLTTTEELEAPPAPTMFRFPDEATGMAALAAAGLRFMDEDGNQQFITASHTHSLDVIGTITRGGEWDDEGNVITPPEVLDGWHLNYQGELPDGWEEFAVYPANPVRKWA
jgi:hypothetical protein